MHTERLQSAQRRAEAYTGPASVDALGAWCAHEDADERLTALMVIQNQELGPDDHRWLELARALVADPDNDCRWQALIAIGGYIEPHPEAVWAVILEHGPGPDDDMRDGVATVLLEHLLEHHFEPYFLHLSELAAGNADWVPDLLERCGPFGQAQAQWYRVEALLSACRSEP